MKKTLAILSAALMATPFLAMAQNAQSVLTTINGLVQQLIPLLLAIALLAFFWGLITYIWKSGDAEAQERGKNIMIAGIVGLFVMVSIWGIVGIIARTFNISTGETQTAPKVNQGVR